MKTLMIRSFLIAVCTLVLFACSKPNSSTQLATLIKDFTNGYYALNPGTAVNNGLHQFDGRLPDYSAAGIQNAIAWYKSMRDKIKAVDASKLTDKEWLHAQQLSTVVDTALFYLEDMKVMENNAWYGYSSLDPDIYLSRAYAPLDVRLRAFITHVNNITGAVPHIKGNLKPMPSTNAYVFKNFAAGLAEFITTTPKDIFADVSDVALQEEMSKATTIAASALTGLAEWIDQQPRNENYSLDKDRYAKMLWSLERIDMSIEELQALATQDLERNLQAMNKACEEFAPKASIVDCITKSSANKFADGPVQGATRQVAMLKQLVIDKNIVTIPTDDVALVAEAPPHQRSNSAYISIPGPYEKGMPSIYYIAPPDPSWSKEEQLAYLPDQMDLLATSVHEVWPGHFLEGLHSNLSGNPVTPLAYSYAFSEGWAHYTEEMMADEAMEYSAEMKIGQLRNALLRNVRFVSSLGLHTAGMTVEQSEKLFLEKAFNDPGNARQQAARGTFDPGYLFYTLGKLMIKQLRVDWMKKHPEKSLKEFHDTFLSYGSAPIPLIRKMMMGR